jgi:hypothetical protein
MVTNLFPTWCGVSAHWLCIKEHFFGQSEALRGFGGGKIFFEKWAYLLDCTKKPSKKDFFTKRAVPIPTSCVLRAPQNRQSLIIATASATLYPVDTSMLPVSTKARPLTGLSTKKPPD